MPDEQPQSVSSPIDPAAERFYAGAVDRIRRFMGVLAQFLIAAVWLKFGIRSALGLALDCVISFVNFYWLKRVIAGFADRATGVATAEAGKGIVPRFLLRYVLMAVGAYALLTVDRKSTRLNSSHDQISYAVFCLKKKKIKITLIIV